MGGAAVMLRVSLPHPLPVLALLVTALCGCRFAGQLVGAAAGGATAAASANPAVGIAVGVAVNSGIDATTSYIARRRQGAEQDAIAGEVATMEVGERRPWKIVHDIPIGNEHGEVHVVDVVTTPIATCKDVIISVADDDARQDYLAWVCRNPQGWKWATAEPATARLGPL